jgi:hypothetical protein
MLLYGRGGALLAVVTLVSSCRTAGPATPISIEMTGTVAGPAEDGGFIGFTMVSPRLRDGTRIAFSIDGKKWPPLVVDSSGAVIDTFAVYGEGPGELGSPSWIVKGSGDSILVFDLGRVLVFDPERHFVRSIPVAARRSWAVAVLPDQGVLTSSASFGDTVPIAAYDLTDGDVRWRVSVPDAPGQSPKVRGLQVAPDGTIWVMRAMQKLELTQYDATGRELRRLSPALPWFPPYEDFVNPTRENAPSPYVVGFWVDSLDRAWIVGQAADPDWATAEGEDIQSEGGTYFRPTRPDDIRDGVLEVVDLKIGRSIARLQQDELFGFVVEPWVLLRNRVTEDGWQQLDLYSVAWRGN